MSDPAAQPRPLVGAMWMLVTGLCFVAVTALVKLVGDAVPAPEAAFLRYVMGCVFLIPMVRPILRARMSGRQWGLFGVRGAVHTIGVGLWFFAMTQIPLAEVTAMNYMVPVYVTVGAAIFLGERLAIRRILAVCLALVGALVILRPGLREVNSGHVAMLFTALSFAASYLLAKRMSDDVSPAIVVGMLSLTVTLGLAPWAALVWVPPSLWDLGILFGVACFATLGHYTMTLAFVAAPVTVTQPVTFLQLVWSILVGWAFFDEIPDAWVVLGAVMIISAISYITWREAVLRARGAA